jgi:hypothetical protein
MSRILEKSKTENQMGAVETRGILKKIEGKQHEMDNTRK